MTHALIQSLEGNPSSIQEWISATKTPAKEVPVVKGADLTEPLFSPRSLLSDVRKILTKLEQAPINIAVLSRLTEQRERQETIDPEGHLNLGIAHAAKGEFDKARGELETAVTQFGITLGPEAHYHLGRVLLEVAIKESKGDLNKAVSELRLAIEQDPENARAHYHLGQAIRELVERESLKDASDALRTYLEKGAPLGHEDEVREFLRTRPEVSLAR